MATKEEKKFCKECGQQFDVSEMLEVGRKFYCKECAREILDKKESGSNQIHIINQQNNSSGSQQGKRPIVKKNYALAVVLSVLFGWLGIDRFYVGHGGLGLLKLFTLGGYGIWWIIDIILFATKSISYVEWE